MQLEIVLNLFITVIKVMGTYGVTNMVVNGDKVFREALYGNSSLWLSKPSTSTHTTGITSSSWSDLMKTYRVRQIKVIPCHVLLISQQWIGIFTRKFTRLFIIHIYS